MSKKDRIIQQLLQIIKEMNTGTEVLCHDTEEAKAKGEIFDPAAFLDYKGIRFAAQDLVEIPRLNSDGEAHDLRRGRIFAFNPSQLDSLHVHHETDMAQHIGWFFPSSVEVVPEHG